MKLYCMCKSNSNSIFFASNRFTLPKKDDVYESVTLKTSMVCIRKGIHQILPNKKRHYPNVDLYKCNHCGAVIAVE